MVKPHFEKTHVFPLKEISLFPAESPSHETAALVLGTKEAHTYALITNVRRSGLSPHEGVVLALLLKQLGVKHAFTLVITGKV